MAVQQDINTLLDPVLFQVIGSTPESIRDAILKSNIKGNKKAGTLLAATAVFASAVNKPTMENFVAKQELYEVRPFITQIFSVSGKANMTGITLLGHCLLTSDIMTGITFCDRLRQKMGQTHLWAGTLESGTLSDAQKKIMTEKRRSIKQESAMLLASCFFKYTGMDKASMSRSEQVFWNGKVNTPARGSPEIVNMPASPVKQTVKQIATNIQENITPGTEDIVLNNGHIVAIPSSILKYYRTVNSPDEKDLIRSIEKRTPAGFISVYGDMLVKDPEMRGAQGGSVLGDQKAD
jgi:hypothetical protein